MTNKLKYFIGNWKMFGNVNSFNIINQIQRFTAKFKKFNKKNKIIICAPSTLVHFFAAKVNKKFISIGAQNCHHENEYGPYTGFVNASMLKNVGAKYIIIGHSENRILGENNKIIKKKIDSCLKSNLNIIFCIGETEKEKKMGKTFFVIKKQLKESLEEKYSIKKIMIAYEPVWSIGTGKLPKPQELKKIFKFIISETKKILKVKKDLIVLYGGSVNEKNVKLFSSILEIDGFLIGGASQSSKKFVDIIKNYYK